MNEKLKRILKENETTKNMNKYIMGEIPIHNVGKDFYYYYWDNLIPDIYKEEGLDSEYTKRVLELLFKYEDYEANKIYFSLFNSKIKDYIRAIEYLEKNLKMKLSNAIYLYLKFEDSLSDNFELLKYFYEKDLVEVEDVISNYGDFNASSESGGFSYYYTDNLPSYLSAMGTLASDDFRKKLKKIILNMYNISSFFSYLPFFKNEEDKKEIILNAIPKVLDKDFTPQETKDVIIKYLEIGEEDKKFDKLIKKIATHNKSYVYNGFTDFIKYKKPNPEDIYEQRLIDISMKIDKYRTIQKLLFVIYTRNFTYKLDKSDIDKLIESWDAINYENIIDYLTYHIAVEYYGLDAKKFFEIYLKENFDKTIDSLKLASGKGLEAVLNIVYDYDKKKTNDFILNNISIFKGKSLINKVVEIILMERDNNNKLIELIKHKKSNVREIALRVLIKIDDEKNIELLKSLRETEKSKVILELLSEYLNDSEAQAEDDNDYFSKSEIMKRANTKKLQDYGDYSEYPAFIWADDNSELTENFTKYLFYLLKRGDKTLIASKETQKILSMLTPESITNFIDLMDDYTKTTDMTLKMISFTKNDKYLDMLKGHIAQLINNYRGAAAAKVVSVIAGFKTTKAVQMLDFLSFKKNAKDARVNRGAVSAMDEMAREMNLTKEDLLDFIIPDFGFDKDGKLSLDFGSRQFVVRLQSDLSMLITDNNDKKFKNLPKVGKNDDTEKGNEATKAFKSIKKELKKQVKIEKERLERGFSESRFWNGENWLKLFVNNPIMRQFAMNLIWGKYKNSELIESFRYLDDGSFSNINDDELNIKNEDTIALIHPIELTEEELKLWQETLDDYEIVQPFEQINRPVFRVIDKNKDVFDDFKGYMLGRFALKNNLFKYGWNRGMVEDAGCFYYYDKSYSDGTNVNLDFLGDYVGNYDDNMEVPIYDITLTKNGEKLKLSEISPRLYSELYYELKKITEKGSGFNKEWEKVSW